ncbi:MAG: NAD(P)-binding protein [Silvanigrellaceae bacterium]
MSLTHDDWLSLQSTGPSGEALERLLSGVIENSSADVAPFPDAIVGGGISGLLAALRLSKTGGAQKLVLLESRTTLGGRLFQTPPSPPGMTRAQVLAEQFHRDALQHSSGPGFELFDPMALEVYERHLRMSLSDEEIEFVDGFVRERVSTEAPFIRKTYLVRKEFTDLGEVLSGSSEMLTRKEAETLMTMASGENINPDNDGPFETSSFWANLPKVQKEALTPLLETVLGWPLDRTPTSVVLSSVQAFVKTHNSESSVWFTRRARLELALETVLLSRGVQVQTQAELVRAFVPAKKGDPTRLQVGDLFSKSARQFHARKVVFAIPLMKTLSILPREQLHAQHSRLVARHRPRSLVWVEYDNWRQALLQHCNFEWLIPGARLVCPVERVQGVCLSNDRLGFFTSIDFEDSLHAQSVREALNRCRKAALRLLSEPHMKAAQQARPAAPGIQLMRERIGLMPVGFNLPRNEPLPEIQEVKMTPGGWYSLGDHFTFGPESWKNVIDSVHEVVQLMAR